jgi:hypothetical protein
VVGPPQRGAGKSETLKSTAPVALFSSFTSLSKLQIAISKVSDFSDQLQYSGFGFGLCVFLADT